jgi:dihydropteroate synthase
MSIICCKNYSLDLSQPKVMGVLNITPDSFYANSRYQLVEQALAKAIAMAEEGAAIIDIGGEPTNPFNKEEISVQQELDRVIPVIENLSRHLTIPLSIDTSQPEVMLAAVKAGASIINDVRALRIPGALAAAAKASVPVILMHMRYLTQAEIQHNVHNIDMMDLIRNFLLERINTCLKAGIAQRNIIIDPGIGAGRFGKTLANNLYILHHLREFKQLEYPLLLGLSRKLFIADLLNLPPNERLFASIAAATLATYNGADIIRTHDVKATVDAVKLAAAMLEVV